MVLAETWGEKAGRAAWPTARVDKPRMDTPRNTAAPDWKEEKQENYTSECI